MASKTPMPCGYDYEFVQEVPEDYTCIICKLAMRNPVETRCGHVFCKACLEEAYKSNPNICPMDNRRLTAQDVFPSKSRERKILSFMIKCPHQGCDWQGELRDIEVHHTSKCLKHPVSCPNGCGKTVKRKEVAGHLSDECPLTIVPCAYHNIGCDVKVQRKDLDHHIEHQDKHHLGIAMGNMASLQEQMDEIKKDIPSTIQDIVKVIPSNAPMMTKDNEGHYNYVWKIKDRKHPQELAFAINTIEAFRSEPFYTHKRGYKLQLVLLHRAHEKTINLKVIPGDYDDKLTWPIPWNTIKAILLDQTQNRLKLNHIEYRAAVNKGMGLNERPQKDDITIASVKVDGRLYNPENYLVNKTIFIKIQLQL